MDQLTPGVAFLVQEHIPVPLDSMTEWFNKGRVLSLSAFLNNRWVTIICGYAPVQDNSSFLEGLADGFRNIACQDVIFFADINQDAKEGAFVKEAQPKYDRHHPRFWFTSGNGFSPPKITNS